MTLALVGLMFGIILLYFGADFIVSGAAALARRLGVSPLLIGMTVVAFGTSLPEAFVSIVAAFKGSDVICISNVVGSNIANITLIMGLAALLCPLVIPKGVIRKEMPIMLGASVIFIIMCMNSMVSRLDGIILFGLFLLFNYLMIRMPQSDVISADEGKQIAPKPVSLCLISVVVGLVMLSVGASFLVDSAVYIARAFNVPEWIIGVTLVALGTSLPELATSLIAIARREDSISVGNIIGSNIFNILFVVGMSGIVRPLQVGGEMNISVDLGIMMASSLLLFIVMMSGTLNRWKGAVLLGSYVGYIAFCLLRGQPGS